MSKPEKFFPRRAALADSGGVRECPMPVSTQSTFSSPAWIAGIFVLSLFTAIAYVAASRAYEEDPFAEESAVAMHLVHGEGFSSPLDPSPHAAPTAWCAPVYPALMAAVWSVAGVNTLASRLGLLGINAVCMAATAVALWLLVSHLFSHRAGAWTVALYVFNPFLLLPVTDYWDECLAVAMFAWSMVAVLWLARGGGRPWHWFGFGVGLGILALTGPQYALAFPLLIAVPLYRSANPHRLRCAGLVILGLVLTLLPWTLRNQRTFGHLFFVRSGLNLEIWLGNTRGNGLTHSVLPFHPDVNSTEGKLYAQLGEVRYFQLCGTRFADDYRQRPLAFWKRCARRAWYLVAGDPTDPDYEGSRTPPLAMRWHGKPVGRLIMQAILTLLAVLGAWQVARRCPSRLWPLAAGLLSVVPYLVSHVQERYAMPLRITVLIFAGLALSRLLTVRDAASS